MLEGVDGQRYRKTYSFEGFRVRMVSKEIYKQSQDGDAAKMAGTSTPDESAAKRSWYAKLRDRVHRFLR